MKLKLLILAPTIFLGASYCGAYSPPEENTGLIKRTNTTGIQYGCTECHSGTTDIGKKLLWAKMGWEKSPHSAGQKIPIIDSYNDPLTGGLLEKIAGWFSGGSLATMGNGSSCQTCHTHEGFVKKQEGFYADNLAIANEVLMYPSEPGCHTCHDPHGNQNFSLSVPNGEPVQTHTLMTYQKPKGSLCASCHYARVMNGRVKQFEKPIDRIMDSLLVDYTPSHFGPHYSVQTDVNLGVQADIAATGYISTGVLYNGKLYANSAHSTDGNANCVTCHMPLRSDMMSHLSDNLGGHSFEITADVNGSEKANLGGCESCHAISYTGTLSAKTPTNATGYLRPDKVYFYDSKDYANSTIDNVVKLAAPADPAGRLNTIMTKIADPDNGCAGLLQTAYSQVTSQLTQGAIVWENNVFQKCKLKSYTGVLPASIDPESDSARLLKSIWNFSLIKDDHSFGLHNPAFAEQLIYDTCEDLYYLVAGAQGTVSGMENACNFPSQNRPPGVSPSQL